MGQNSQPRFPLIPCGSGPHRLTRRARGRLRYSLRARSSRRGFGSDLYPPGSVPHSPAAGRRPAAATTSPAGDWFADNAPKSTTKQPDQFPEYSPAGTGIKRPDLSEQYKKDTAAGPLTKPGAAEKAIGVDPEAMGTAALATAAGAAGAGPVAEVAPAVLGAIGTGAAWAKQNPVIAGLGYHIARELGIPLPKVLDVLAKYKE
jgi:hypothetical protein